MRTIIEMLRDECKNSLIIECEISDREEQFINLLWGFMLPWYCLHVDRVSRPGSSYDGALQVCYSRTPNWISSNVCSLNHIFTDEVLSGDIYEYAKEWARCFVIRQEIDLLRGRQSNIDYLIKLLESDQDG